MAAAVTHHVTRWQGPELACSVYTTGASVGAALSPTGKKNCVPTVDIAAEKPKLRRGQCPCAARIRIMHTHATAHVCSDSFTVVLFMNPYAERHRALFTWARKRK